MIVAGCDYSINCPCVCVFDTSLELNHTNCSYFFQENNVSQKERERRYSLVLSNIFPSEQYKWKDDYHRYFVLADFFLSIFLQYGVSRIAIENYSLGSKGKVFNIAEATGILKNLCMLSGIEMYAFPPTSTKKIFSGKGNANKEVMVKAYEEKYGVSIPSLYGKETYDSPVSDIVDSHAQLYNLLNNEEIENFKIF